MKYTVINNTCENMSILQNESVDCIFTSPPYAFAKDYGQTEHIGGEDSENGYQDYLNRMETVLTECYRVLKTGHYIGINIADVTQELKTGEWIRRPIQFDLFNMLVKIGFKYKDVIMWKKPDGLATQMRYGLIMQHPYPMYYNPNKYTEPILVFRKGELYKPNAEEKQESKINPREARYFNYQGDVWEFSPETRVRHPAPFPVGLAETFIQFYCLKGKLVLDPFLGSGTTMKAARNLRRECVGFEINPDYIPLIRERVGFAEKNQQTLVEQEDILTVVN